MVLIKWYFKIKNENNSLFNTGIFTNFCFWMWDDQKKSDEVVKKENKKLSKFIGQPESELKIVMGNPDTESKSETGTKILIYNTKKYGIPCERKFEVDENKMVIGFNSKGCF